MRLLEGTSAKESKIKALVYPRLVNLIYKCTLLYTHVQSTGKPVV